jgi:short-subunit dehydrogenase
MKILITGTRGLGNALAEAYCEHNVIAVSKSTGHDIKNISQWGSLYLDCDLVFNCAYDGYAQVDVLEFFFNHWKDLSNKTIVSIGSKAIYGSRIENTQAYWAYQTHKIALQSAHNSMLATAKCDIKIFNPGPVDTEMIAHHSVPKYSTNELATVIKKLVAIPTIKRTDLWI